MGAFTPGSLRWQIGWAGLKRPYDPRHKSVGASDREHPYARVVRPNQYFDEFEGLTSGPGLSTCL